MISIPLPTTARLSHLCDDPIYKEEVPYEIWADNVPKDIERTNVKLNIVPDCPLTDIRGLDDEDKPQLETCGFQWFHQDFPYHTGLHGADDVNTTTQAQSNTLDGYLTTMSDFLSERLGCEKVVCWDWRVRRSKLTAPRTRPNIYSLEHVDATDLRTTKINSSHIIHADGSPEWMQKVIAKVTTQDEQMWAKGGKYRTRVLTVWRPLVDVVQTDPLVCCDVRTVDESDLDIVQKVMDNTVEESMYLKRREQHQWYWMSDQTRDDVLVMTVWDSRRPLSKSVAVPHCAMVLSQHVPDAKPRESIELRFVVWNAE
ncbi:uncharacterized protein TRIVIDRAFT_223951 [Trichoderma virens Gv29-8]|uniref:Uncharacterized protein n=1 Tax=Hypocrea virens (strain Gv29-8 / FGSC 10586) TaxID=413071 RepID=G9MYL6_HYPVG|nr:uncharacterized protein TRIVIDRAFT_223951 [Trichoderma virens Gv29-8]EHK20636.1 hypothetical protein TRIVIDRAFT_223951 [Trichoderma virens Gv29-8]UKZ53096.1 hypothetical protein TrVGV298_006884 [Trichoderma virens]